MQSTKSQYSICLGWTMTSTPISVEPCTVEPPGPLIPVSRDPLEVFSWFFTDDLLSLIVRETNRYAAQCLANTQTTWETDVEEIRAYLGFMVVMGIDRLPEIRDYWSADPKMNNSFISFRITRTRFEEISRYLHFVDNNTLPARDEPGYHRLQKVMPIITALRKAFLENYSPYPQNTIDEAMIPFKGMFCVVHNHTNQRSNLIFCVLHINALGIYTTKISLGHMWRKGYCSRVCMCTLHMCTEG